MATSAPGVSTGILAGESTSETVRGSDVSPRQERVLSEISHELGNYFHKLYYWAEILREQRPATADAEPADLLEQTIRDLETFLKTALEFFRPITVAPMALSVDDLTSSIRALVMRHLDPVPVRWKAEVQGGTASVSVDPGRFSFVLEGLVRRLHVAEQTVVSATVRTEGPTGNASYVLELTARGLERGPGLGAATIEWAIIERIVDLHGGTVDSSAVSGERTVRLRLPIRP